MTVVQAIDAESVLRNLRARNTFTPDWNYLSKHPKSLVFVWDHCKKDYYNNSYYLRENAWLGRAYTIEPDFIMKHSQVNVIVLESSLAKWNKGKANNIFTGPEPTNVKGEVFAVSPWDLHRLDMLMMNTYAYNRERRYIVLKDQASPLKGGRNPVVEVWMYIGNKAYWDENGKNFHPCVTVKEEGSNRFMYDWNKKIQPND